MFDIKDLVVFVGEVFISKGVVLISSIGEYELVFY